MFKQTYQSMISRIHPANSLIKDTKQKILTPQPHAQAKKWVPVGAATACVVIAAAAVLANPLPVPTVLPAAVSASSSTSLASAVSKPEIQTPLQNGKYESVVKLADGVLNFMDTNAPPQGNRKLYFDPKTTHEEQWTEEKTVKYLGKDIRPAYLPENLSKNRQEADNATQFVIMNNDGTAAYDNINYYYYADPENPASPSLSVKASKGKLPLECVLYRSQDQKESTINGSKLLVGHEVIQSEPVDGSSAAASTYDLYYAEFQYEGVGYRVVSKYLPQEEFVKVLVSLFESSK